MSCVADFGQLRISVKSSKAMSMTVTWDRRHRLGGPKPETTLFTFIRASPSVSRVSSRSRGLDARLAVRNFMTFSRSTRASPSGFFLFKISNSRARTRCRGSA